MWSLVGVLQIDEHVVEILILEHLDLERIFSSYDLLSILESILVEELAWKLADSRFHTILDIEEKWLESIIKNPLEQ